MPEFESLLSLLPYIKIVHQLPGRVRFKFARDLPRVEMPSVSRATVKHLIDELPGVLELSFKAFARSLTIEYNNQIIADTAWADFLNAQETAEAQDLELKLRLAYAKLQRQVEFDNA